ncbi:MAG: hypothetical protein HKM04_09800 [Legionellales bacterium]|nr:hypothetical protein [Legionellales bacterium]
MNNLLEKALPQKPPMRLIDRIIELNNTQAICEAFIEKNHIFYDSNIDGLAPWIGIEMMAQTAAVFVYGHQNKIDGVENRGLKEAKIAFLMSVRQFHTTISHIPAGSTLIIIANSIFLDEETGVFECQILQDSKAVAEARLSAYQPSLDKLTTLLAGCSK